MNVGIRKPLENENVLVDEMPAAQKGSLRMAVADGLRRFADRIFETLNSVADRVGGGICPDDDDDEELWREAAIMGEALYGRIQAKFHHPCPECRGNGAVPTTGDDVVSCHVCEGTGIDPKYLARSLR